MALTRPVAVMGLPFTYVVVLAFLVVGGFIVTKSFLWLIASAAIGYGALRALAAYEPRIFDLLFTSLSRTPLTPSWFKGKGIIYRA